jgi:hypothetical protein
MKLFLAATLALLSCSCANRQLSDVPQFEHVGMAEMGSDGTITLRLASRERDGTIVHGLQTYPTSSPHYLEVLNHLGGLTVGERKPIPPWLDK